jgi:integrase/recombinase XerD
VDHPLVVRFVGLQASPRTRQVYRSDLRDLEGFLEVRKVPLLRIREEDALAWRSSLEARSLAPSSVSRKLTVARMFFNFVLDQEEDLPAGSPRRNPFSRVKPPRFDRSLGKTPCPSQEEVERLLQSTVPETAIGLRDRALLLLLFHQGLRVSEVAKLRTEHLRQQDGHLILGLLGKGGSVIQTVLAPPVARVLREHLGRSVPSGGNVFRAMPRNPGFFTQAGRVLSETPITIRSIHERVKHYARKAGLDPSGVRPHSGRVFFITSAYLKCRDLERVARAVGHRNLATTRRYLRLQETLSDHPSLLIRLDLGGGSPRPPDPSGGASDKIQPDPGGGFHPDLQAQRHSSSSAPRTDLSKPNRANPQEPVNRSQGSDTMNADETDKP